MDAKVTLKTATHSFNNSFTDILSSGEREKTLRKKIESQNKKLALYTRFFTPTMAL